MMSILKYFNDDIINYYKKYIKIILNDRIKNINVYKNYTQNEINTETYKLLFLHFIFVTPELFYFDEQVMKSHQHIIDCNEIYKNDKKNKSKILGKGYSGCEYIIDKINNNAIIQYWNDIKILYFCVNDSQLIIKFKDTSTCIYGFDERKELFTNCIQVKLNLRLENTQYKNIQRYKYHFFPEYIENNYKYQIIEIYTKYNDKQVNILIKNKDNKNIIIKKINNDLNKHYYIQNELKINNNNYEYFIINKYIIDDKKKYNSQILELIKNI